jgi:hypothetical protein
MTGQYYTVRLLRRWEDLGVVFHPGEVLTVRDGCPEYPRGFFSFGLWNIPKDFCEVLQKDKGVKE